MMMNLVFEELRVERMKDLQIGENLLQNILDSGGGR